MSKEHEKEEKSPQTVVVNKKAFPRIRDLIDWLQTQNQDAVPVVNRMGEDGFFSPIDLDATKTIMKRRNWINNEPALFNAFSEAGVYTMIPIIPAGAGDIEHNVVYLLAQQ